nr:GUN4 domain-containing protein [Phormidium sp. FACHB-592]
MLIGVSEYEPGLNPLPAAVKDIAAMQRVLLDPEMGGFDEAKPLANPDPQAMQYEIETLFSGCTKDDLVLLFFSGHGIKDDSGRLYFASRITQKNAKGDLMRSTAVPTSFVHDIMNNSRCKRQAIILDCCFSGAFDPALRAKDDGSVDLQSQLGAEGRVVLTSSSSTEYSFEQQGSELSIYTRYLVEGIETGAGDRNEDGFVSVLELHEYAASKVQETAPKMTPKIIVLKDKGFEIVLAKAKVTDPKLKYRKAALRYANAGTIPPRGQAILKILRQQLGLTLEEATEIEVEVLRPYQERLANLQRYRETLIAEADYEYPLSEFAREDLNTLQQMLGLRDEDILPIQQAVEAQFAQQSAAYQQNLFQYEQVLNDAIQREFPFSQQTHQELGNLQQSLGLRDEDIARARQPLVQPAEVRYQEKLRQEANRQRQEQARVEYENRLRRYEEEFTKAIAAQYPLDSFVRDGLTKFQQSLELSDKDVARIEAPLVAPQEATYQEQRRKEAERQLELKRQQKLEQQRQQQLEQEGVEKLRQMEAQERQWQEAEELKRQQIEAERLRQEELERQWVLEQQRREKLPRRQAAQTASANELASEKGIDYTRLRDLLKAGQWQEADKETGNVMLKATGQEERGYLLADDMEQFPCTDLRTIDQLWVKYSDGKFGFSVQKKIWEEVGQNVEEFNVAVGWRVSKIRIRERVVLWMKREEQEETWEWVASLTFSLGAPKGHLPGGWRQRGGGWSALAFRLIKCNL